MIDPDALPLEAEKLLSKLNGSANVWDQSKLKADVLKLLPKLLARLAQITEENHCLSCNAALHGDGQCASCSATEVFGLRAKLAQITEEQEAAEDQLVMRCGVCGLTHQASTYHAGDVIGFAECHYFKKVQELESTLAQITQELSVCRGTHSVSSDPTTWGHRAIIAQITQELADAKANHARAAKSLAGQYGEQVQAANSKLVQITQDRESIEQQAQTAYRLFQEREAALELTLSRLHDEGATVIAEMLEWHRLNPDAESVQEWADRLESLFHVKPQQAV